MDDIVNDFFNSVEKLYGDTHNGDGDGFALEFQDIKQQSFRIKQNTRYKCASGELAENKKKNRYKDILPFDCTRVKLLSSDDDSDYINASLIKGPDGNASYIAAQGPLPHTVNNFWSMLWDYNVKVIIMVCQEEESGKKKCERYWPTVNSVKQFGDVNVTLEAEELDGNTKTGYCKRFLRANKGQNSRKLLQLHYVTWPDHGVPCRREEILNMIDAARTAQTYSEDTDSPLCVHCSAGCGRTGAVLVVDYFRNLLIHKKLKANLRVYDVVIEMRKQRPAIVQTKDQYEFVHLVVLEMFTKYLKHNGKKMPKSNLSISLLATDYENISFRKEPKIKQERNTGILYENVSEHTDNAQKIQIANAPSSGMKESSRDSFGLMQAKSSSDYSSHNQNAAIYSTSSKSPSKVDLRALPSKPAKRTNSDSRAVASPNSGLSNVRRRSDAPVKPLKPTGIVSDTASIAKPRTPLASTKPLQSTLSSDTKDQTSSPPIRPKPKIGGKSTLAVSESLQARKERLWSQGMQGKPNNLDKHCDVSKSVMDLRTLSNFTSHCKQNLVRTSSFEHAVTDLTVTDSLFFPLKKEPLLNCNNNNNVTHVVAGDTSSYPIDANKSLLMSNKPSQPSAIMKPLTAKPVVPKKQNSVRLNKPRTEKEFAGSGYLSVAMGNPAADYVNISSDSVFTKDKNDYEHINNQPLNSVSSNSTYDILNRSGANAINIGTKVGPSPYVRTPLSSVSSVFEASSKTSHEFDANSSFNKLHGFVFSQDKAVTGNKPAPPLKPKRTLRKNSRPHVSTDSPNEVKTHTPFCNNKLQTDDDDTHKASNIYATVDASHNTSPPNTLRIPSPRPRSSSMVSQRSEMTALANMHKIQLSGKTSVETAPALPERTLESMILNSPDSTESKYEDLHTDKYVQSEFSRPSGHLNPSSGVGIKAKAKGVIEKTTTAFNAKVNAFQNISTPKDDTTSAKNRPSYVPDPYMCGNDDISFANRFRRKPKGPRPPPGKWMSK